MSIKPIVVLLTLLFFVGIVSAAPTASAAFNVASNNFTVTVAGSDGGDTWIGWGQHSGIYPWASGWSKGNGNIEVFGAPIIGGSTIYFVACDHTGCSAERTVSIPAITPVPTTTFGATYKTLTDSHMKLTLIPQSILPGYFASGISATMLWGLMFFFMFFGFWFRTRSVRLTLVLGFLMAAFILSPTAGLYLGAPLMMQYVAQGLMAAAIAGVFIAFIRK